MGPYIFSVVFAFANGGTATITSEAVDQAQCEQRMIAFGQAVNSGKVTRPPGSVRGEVVCKPKEDS